MPNYKEMYLKMFRASEQAVRLLISAQQECEKIYTFSAERELKVISPISTEKKDNTDDQ